MSTPGRTLGRYELIARIGEGGMAEVFLARQRGPRAFEKLVVVKTVHPRLASKPALAEALLEEARIAAKVRHPHVVDIYDLGEEDGTYFIAMEYLEGESMTSIIRAQRATGGARLAPLRVVQVVADCAAGLHAAHELRSLAGEPLELVHQDVTPGNVFVLYTGQAKLLDFGVAKVRSSEDAGLVKGKAGYLAPELFDKHLADRRSDVFALGVVLWESLTLRRLFAGATDAEAFDKIRACVVPAPSTLAPGIPPELDAVCARALTRSRDERYPTARAMQDELVELLRGAGRGDYDAMAAYMRTAFAGHIAARQQLLRELDKGGLPEAGTLEVLTSTFGEGSGEPSGDDAPAIAAPVVTGTPAEVVKPLLPLPGPGGRRPLPRLGSVGGAARGPLVDAPLVEVPAVGPVAVAAPEVADANDADDADDAEEVSGVIDVDEPVGPPPIPSRPPPALVDSAAAEPVAVAVAAIGTGGADGELAADLALVGAGRSRRLMVAAGLAALAVLIVVVAVVAGGSSSSAPAAHRPASTDDPAQGGVAIVADAGTPLDAALVAVAVDAGGLDATAVAVAPDAAPRTGLAPGGGAGEPPRVADPARGKALTQTGLQQFMRGDTGGAIASFQAALRADRGQAAAQRGLGLAYEKQGDKGRAARAFRAYLALAPNARDADQIRARLAKL